MAASKSSLSAGEIIRSMLLAEPAVADKVTKIFPVATSQAVLPYILYRRTSLLPAPLKAGQADTVEIEVMCYTERYTEGVALAEAVRSALDCRQAALPELVMRSCFLSSSEEYWADDAFVQSLTFTIKI